MIKLLFLKGPARTDMDTDARAQFTKAVIDFKLYLNGWEGDSRLK